MISYNDFKNTELKVGTVVSAEKHPDADKLLVLKVDVGEEEPRQLVAGIAEHYSPEELQGKRIVVVANLEPVNLRGQKSNGMILAAEDKEGKIVLLTTDKEISDGSQVC